MTLHSLSDQELLYRIHELTRRERKLTLTVLLHLNEIERRQLHLALAYKSMFEYCTDALGYSESAASRRIRVARCVVRFPEVYALLEANEVNLSTVAQASRVITPENKDALLARMRGRSQRQIEAIVAEYEPLAALPRDRVRTVVVRVPVAPAAGAGTAGAGAVLPALPAPRDEPGGEAPLPSQEQEHNRNGCEYKDAATARKETPAGAARLERRRVIQFSASETFWAKFAKASSLVSHRLPAGASFEAVVEIALDLLIAREDPAQRHARREARAKQRANGPRSSSTTKHPAHDKRAVAAAVRDEVFERDHHRCTFTGPDGRRCAATHTLQIDHVVPVARGGAGTADNLRVLCAQHNRFEAEQLMGPCGRHRGA